MSRLTDLYKRVMYGQAKPTMEGFDGVPYFTNDAHQVYSEDNAPSLEPTQGLFGTRWTTIWWINRF
jgi:hypothetical protein